MSTSGVVSSVKDKGKSKVGGPKGADDILTIKSNKFSVLGNLDSEL